MQEISNDRFDEKVMHADSSVLLVFGAEWCGHCRALLPVIEQLSRERSDVAFFHVDIESQPALAERFSVMSIPSLFLIQNGNIISHITGAQPKHVIEAMIDRIAAT